ncbi:MAG: SpoIIE family protein phosphatase [Anaerolineae bacterium]
MTVEITQSRLLIVGGDVSQRSALLTQLAEQGHEVEVVETARAAQVMLDDGCRDLMFLGTNLPDTGSRDLVAHLRVKPHLDGMPILVLAEPGEIDALDSFFQVGVDDYIILPITPALLNARVAVNLENKRLRDEQKVLQRSELLLKIEHDVEVARNIQASFLVKELPQPAGWDMVAHCLPARDVAGDFYDGFNLLHGRRVALVIGDVVDKGIPAALFMALCRSLTRAFAQQNYSLSWADILQDAPAGGRRGSSELRGAAAPTTGITALKNAITLTNNYINDNHMELNYFATMFMGILDPANGQLAYINAGHTPCFIIGADGALKARLKSTGPAVGMLPGVEFKTATALIEPGDTLFTYTDGVPEARNPNREFFTEKRVLELLAEPTSSARALLERIEATLLNFIDTADQFDDITMLIAHRQP